MTRASDGRSRRSRLLWVVARWEQVFQSLVAAITVTMVFVIQHIQSRHQAATQRKLDEILRVLPDANKSLVTLEHASDSELRAARRQHSQIRQTALDEFARRGEQEADAASPG